MAENDAKGADPLRENKQPQAPQGRQKDNEL